MCKWVIGHVSFSLSLRASARIFVSRDEGPACGQAVNPTDRGRVVAEQSNMFLALVAANRFNDQLEE